MTEHNFMDFPVTPAGRKKAEEEFREALDRPSAIERAAEGYQYGGLEIPEFDPDAPVVLSERAKGLLGPAQWVQEKVTEPLGAAATVAEVPSLLGLAGVPGFTDEFAWNPEQFPIQGQIGGFEFGSDEWLEAYKRNIPVGTRVATEIGVDPFNIVPGLGFVPFSAVTRGASVAARAVSEAPVLRLLKSQVAEAATNKKIGIKILKDQPRVRVIEEKPLSGLLPENGPPIAPTSGTHRVYHGTARVFDAFGEGAQSTDALYGPGVYTTENASVASSYAITTGQYRKLPTDYSGQPIDYTGRILDADELELARAGGTPNVWSMDVRVNKFLDIDAPPNKELIDILKGMESKGYGIDEGFEATRFNTFDELETNHDLYQFLLGIFGNKAEVNDWLIANQFDTITHVGGARTGTNPHRVWISLDSGAVSPAFGKNKPSAAAMIDAPTAAAAPTPPAAAAPTPPAGRVAAEGAERFVTSEKIAQGQPLRVIDDADPSLLTVETPQGNQMKIGRGAVRDVVPEGAAPTPSPAAAAPSPAPAQTWQTGLREYTDKLRLVRPTGQGLRAYKDGQKALALLKKMGLDSSSTGGSPSGFAAVESKLTDYETLTGPFRQDAASRQARQPAWDAFVDEIDNLSTTIAAERNQAWAVSVGMEAAPAAPPISAAPTAPTSATAARAAGTRAKAARAKTAPGRPTGEPLPPPPAGRGAEPPPTAPGAGATSGDDYIPPSVADLIGSYEKPLQPERVGLKQRALNAYIKLQEQWIDRFAWGNRQASIARREIEALGEKMTAIHNFEIQASFLGASDSVGLQVFIDGQQRALAALGPNIRHTIVDSYLHLMGSLDILKEKGAERLISGGIKDQAEVEQRLAGLAAQMGPEKMERIRAAATEYADLARRLLERDVDEGFITRELADELNSKYHWYTPIVYQDVLLEHGSNYGSRRISVIGNDLKRLSAVGRDAERELPTGSLLQHAIRGEVRRQSNRAANALIENLLLDPTLKGQIKKINPNRIVAQVDGKPVFRPASGELPGTISRMVNGKREVWNVPDAAEAMAKRMGESPLGDMNLPIRMLQTPFRHAFITYNPAFMAAQAVFDSFTVLITRGVTPFEVGFQLLKNLKGMFIYDAKMSEIIRSGGSVIGWHGRSAKQVADKYAKTGRVITYNQQTVKKVLTNPWEFLRDIGHAIELAPRRAVYQKGLRKGLSQDEAALAFRRSTVDFQRTGQSMRLANSLFLFLNPAVQGSLLPFRQMFIRSTPGARRVAIQGIGALMGMTVGVYGWNRTFSEYADVPLYDKYGGMVIMLPSNEYDKRGNKVPHYIKMPPMLRELSAFTGPITYMLGKMDDQSPESVGQFTSQMFRQLNPFGSIVGGGLPVPTALGETAIEMWMNKDVFRDRPIVPEDLENLPTDQQYDERTSETARRIGGFLNYSPMKIDHLLRQGAMWEVMGGLDAGLRAIDDDEDPYIVGLAERLKDIQENVKPEQVTIERRRFLADLSQKVRDAVLEEERKPEPEEYQYRFKGFPLPFAKSVERRFSRKQSGNLYRSGQAAAQKATGIDPKQTREASIIIGNEMDKLQTTQEQVDAALEAGKIDHAQWRGVHKDSGKLYQGVLGVIQTRFPMAGQVAKPADWVNYMKHVATVGKTMPDRRSKGELLYAAWRGIAPEELAPGTDIYDWNTYYQHRDEFMGSLSTADADLLVEWRRLTMTPKEVEYDEDMETLRPYWQIEDDLVATLSRAEQHYWEQYRAADSGLRYVIESQGDLRPLQEELAKRRQAYRYQHTDVDVALDKWGYAGKPMTEPVQRKAMEQFRGVMEQLPPLRQRTPAPVQPPMRGAPVLPSRGQPRDSREMLEGFRSLIPVGR